MIARKAIAGLALLSALLFCALAAQGASAAAHTSENTTAFTCVKVKPGTGQFEDPHCDTTKAEGEYAHELIPAGTTEIELTNAGTGAKTETAVPSTLKSKVPGAEAHIECKTVSGTGSIHNEGTGTDHKVTGSITVNFGIKGTGDCTVLKPANCKVEEPIVAKATFMGVDQMGPEKNTMGVEFEQEGANFAVIKFLGEKCSVNGKEFPVTGSAIATGKPGGAAKESGATAVFESGNEMQSLKLGAEPASFTATGTVRMKEKEGKVQNPITLTTTT